MRRPSLSWLQCSDDQGRVCLRSVLRNVGCRRRSGARVVPEQLARCLADSRITGHQHAQRVGGQLNANGRALRVRERLPVVVYEGLQQRTGGESDEDLGRRAQEHETFDHRRHAVLAGGSELLELYALGPYGQAHCADRVHRPATGVELEVADAELARPTES